MPPKIQDQKPDWLFDPYDESAKPSKNLQWASLIGRHWVGDYEVRPLTSTLELIEEGEAMTHCVGTFDRKCYRGEYRIFSIMGNASNRLASLSIRYIGDRWIFDQCYGQSNAEVCTEDSPLDVPSEDWQMGQPTDIYFVAMDIVCRYNRKVMRFFNNSLTSNQCT